MNIVQRPWGFYKVLYQDGSETKVKELVVNPGQRLSMQRHYERSEFWFITQGTATVYTLNRSTDLELFGIHTKHSSLWIPKGFWHQLTNESTEPLHVVEIQYGTNCQEEDIERVDNV